MLSDVLGTSGRAMVRGIIDGRTDPGWLADYAKGSLRGKREELELVLRGSIREHHRFPLGELMANLDFIAGKIVRVEAEIARAWSHTLTRSPACAAFRVWMCSRPERCFLNSDRI
ncbi:MAG TPA: hypothetical protein VLI55_16980 [Bryobacteraceae bacterium]|nr:hypothetical protein [Bryobacteraceae bacterium]